MDSVLDCHNVVKYTEFYLGVSLQKELYNFESLYKFIQRT
jgi:hypothetical protein